MSLKTLLGEELFNQVKEKIGDKKLLLDDGNFIPKNRFEEVVKQKNELKQEVDNLNVTLSTNSEEFEKLKKDIQGNEELQGKLTEYQGLLENTQTKFKETLSAKEQEWNNREIKNRKAYTVREKLLTEHVDKDYIDLLMSKVDFDTITESEGKLIGVDDVISNIKTNYKRCFDEPRLVGTGVATGSTVVGKENLSKLAEKAKGGSREDRLAYMKAKQEIIIEE